MAQQQHDSITLRFLDCFHQLLINLIKNDLAINVIFCAFCFFFGNGLNLTQQFVRFGATFVTLHLVDRGLKLTDSAFESEAPLLLLDVENILAFACLLGGIITLLEVKRFFVDVQHFDFSFVPLLCRKVAPIAKNHLAR